MKMNKRIKKKIKSKRLANILADAKQGKGYLVTSNNKLVEFDFNWGKFGYERDYPWIFDTEYRAPSFDRFSKFLLQDKEIITIELIGYISSITNL